ncbi:MAG: HlyD family efflux transporter periplasmic adaptor subunit [Bacteroidales bacterium]
MNRTVKITIIIVTLSVVALFVFARMTSKGNTENLYTEVQEGRFELSIIATGELVPEKSTDINAPEIQQRGGPRGGGGDIRSSMMRISDIVPEGTIVKEGDYVARLDRTEYDNTLKDDYERLTSLKSNLEMKLLDTAVSLNSLRDDIKNQKYLVAEAELKLRNSKYEAPDIIRQAEIGLDKAQRTLEQKERYYLLRKAQTLQDIKNNNWYISRVQSRIDALEELLLKFNITAPSDGMVIYKRDMRGIKRKSGSMITPFDRVVASIPDLSVMNSKTYVSEIEVNKVKPGMLVDITIDAFPLKSYKGKVLSVANIGEELPNSDSKVFETLIRIEGSDPALRPAMTTSNKINIKTIEKGTYVPSECIMADKDSITFVYTRNRTKRIVIPGESNDKNTLIINGLDPGTIVYLSKPENSDRFRTEGEDLVPVIRERNRKKNAPSGL